MMPTIHMQNRRAQIPHCVFMGLPYILCLCLLKEYIYMHFLKMKPGNTVSVKW